MLLSFFRRRGSDSSRARMLTESNRAGQDLASRSPDGRVRQPPWWKEWLGIGTKREWVIVGVGYLFFIGYTFEQDGLWKAAWVAATTAAGLLFAAWWKKRREAEERRGPVLGLRDSWRERYGRRG